MNNRRFPREKQSKFVKCPCGGTAKLIVRQNHRHGRNSRGIHIRSYVCPSCSENKLIKPTGGKNGKIW